MRIAVALFLAVFCASLDAAPRRRAANPPHVIVSDEIAVGTLEYDATRAHHQTPRVASSGTESIAIWLTYEPASSRSALYFVRIDAQGRALDVPQRLLPVQAGVAWDVTWDGREYVVFADAIVRIARDGRVVSVRNAPSTEKASAAAIASNGSNLALLRTVSDRTDLYILELDGRVIRRIDLGFPSREVALASGDGYAVASNTGAGIRVLRFAADGSPIGNARFVGGATASSPDVTFAGDDVYVVWSENGVRGTRPFSSSVVTTIPTERPALSPQVAWNVRTGAITAVWKQSIGTANLHDRWALHAANLDAPQPLVTILDELTDSWHVTASGPVPPPAIVATDAGLLVAWTDGPSVFEPVQADVFTMILDVAPAQRISSRARSQLHGDVAALPGSLAVVWIEDGSVWAEVGERGALRIGSAWSLPPQIATNGVEFFVVWLDGPPISLLRDVRLARLDREGNLLEPPVTIARTQGGRVDIACTTGDCVVAWSTETGVFGHRITPRGTLIGFTPFFIGFALFDFTVASNGRDYLAAYSTAGTVEIVRIVGDTAQHTVQLVGSSRVEIASNGDEWLVVTRQGDRFRFSRITAAGALASDNFLPAPDFLVFRVGWTGRDYVFAASRGGDMVVGHVSADGRVTSGSGGTLIAGSPDDEAPAGIASMGDGTAYMLYSRVMIEHAFAPRLFLRFYDP